MIANLIFVFTALATANAQYSIDGACPIKKPMPNIDMNKYAGLYYEYLQTEKIIGNCVRTTYTNTDNGVIINETVVDDNGVKSFSDGYLEDHKDYWVEKFATPIPHEPRYVVLETDYEYTLLWYCYEDPNNEGKSLVIVYVLTRQREVSDALAKKVDEAFQRHDINVPVVKIDQSCE